VETLASSPPRNSLGIPVTASIVLHAAIVALFVVLRSGAPAPAPPIYRVNMVAAPPGPVASGVVTPTPPPPTPAQTTPIRPKVEPKVAPLPTSKKPPPTTRAPQQATPTPPAATPTKANSQPAPAAGGGEVGGKGADVANVNLNGIEFPYPGYLENIVRQIALNFKPSVRGAFHAEVTFLIRRDGSVDPATIKLTQRSGNYEFDLDARGAVEAAANARRFGPLPSGFPDDVLPVIFLFDPALIRR
jgi:periplasmic protein TonB